MRLHMQCNNYSTMAKAPSITSSWLQQHSDLYQAAVRAPFILSIRNGSLDFGCYNRWLEQDYLFVKEFVRYIASILAKTPDSVLDEEVDVLLGGLNALQHELAWFRSQALKWNLSLEGTTPHQTTQRYCKFLKELSDPNLEYPLALATLWVIEVVYNDSFATCLETDAKTAPELQEACRRWGSEEFKGYCASLKQLADKALEETSPAVKNEAEEFFKQVLRHEVEFWSMSFDNSNEQGK